jgi:hypothetical protein
VSIEKLKFRVDKTPIRKSDLGGRAINDSDSEDLNMKLEIDKLNDIKNIMYLKSKIITDTKKIITNRPDYKKLMLEKNKKEILEEHQRLEVKKMLAADFINKKNYDTPPTPLQVQDKQQKLFINLNSIVDTKKKSSMRDFFLPLIDKEGRNEFDHTTNTQLLSNFKTTFETDFDTRPRINSTVAKNTPRIPRHMSMEVIPNSGAYLIRKEFSIPGNIPKPKHKRINSNVSLMFKGMGIQMGGRNQARLAKIEESASIFSSKPKRIKRLSVPGGTFIEKVNSEKLSTKKTSNLPI